MTYHSFTPPISDITLDYAFFLLFFLTPNFYLLIL